MKKKQVLYLNCSENTLKVYALNYLNPGDSVLVVAIEDSWVDFFYSKPVRYGRWQLNKTEAQSAPLVLFKNWSSN